MTDSLQGWYADPYSRHEARWFSDGIPTGLVRDGSSESQDPPPDASPIMVPVKIDPGAASSFGSDLVRADDVNRSTYDPNEIKQAAFDVFTRTMPSPSYIFGAGERFTPATWPPGGSPPARKWRSRLWLIPLILGLLLFALSFQPPNLTAPTHAMTRSEMAEATATPISTRFDEVPACGTRFGLNPSPDVDLDASAAGQVVTLYEGQVVEIDFDDGESTSSIGKTLCSGGDSGSPTGPDDHDIESGDYDYGAMGKGMDFVALPKSEGGESLFALSIVPMLAPSGLTTAQIALRVTGTVLVAAGMFLLIREWRQRRARRPVRGH